MRFLLTLEWLKIHQKLLKIKVRISIEILKNFIFLKLSNFKNSKF